MAKQKTEPQYKELNVKVVMVPIEDLRPNPKNPRIIRDNRFMKLKQSISEFPEMLQYRTVIADRLTGKPYIILGGNQRYEACRELGYKEVPVMFADDMSEEQKRRFIPVDNVGFGEWNTEILDKDYGYEELLEFGLEAFELSIEAPAFTPTLDPVVNTDRVTQEQIEKRAKELAAQMVRETKSIDCICPNCGHEFAIDKA